MPESESSSTSASTFERGRLGEARLVAILREQGYTIIHQNLKTPFGEVDVVAVRENQLTIFEVKTRYGAATPKRIEVGRFLGRRQTGRLKRAARWLWQRYRRKYSHFRCQLIIVTDCEIRAVNLPLLYDNA